MIEEIYKTSNLGLAGYFSCEGIMPDDMLKGGQMRTRPESSVYTFCYNDEMDTLKDMEKKYFSGKALVDPKRYEYEKKTLKELIDNIGKRE